MARGTGLQAAARRRRIKHEQRINDRVNPLEQLALTWSWLYAEARRHPHLLHTTRQRMHAIAADLNDCEAKEGEQP